MGIKEGALAHFVNAPASAMEAIRLPELHVSADLEGDFDYIHFYCPTQSEMHDTFPILKHHVKPVGMLWLSWPKEKRLGSDLNLAKVIEIGYSYGLVESTCLRIDDTWAGLKFTHPKKGKVYNNSHGTLPDV
ncbi:MAG: hypothetical protein H7288_13025 [Kineosporiaceae bacterium]|nr:hypothetical protein [Aeromicrobium sp.]